MAPAALLIPALITAGGAAYAGYTSYQQGKAEAAQAEYNAAVAEAEAKAVEQKTEYEQRRQAKSAARQMSSLQAGLGASGAVTTTGAPLLLQAEQAVESELENLMIGYEGETEARRARSQAAAYKMEASAAKQRGRMGLVSSVIGASSTLLTGFKGTSTRQQAISKGVSPWAASSITGRTKSGGYYFGR